MKTASASIQSVLLGYSPDPLNIAPNTDVTWTNSDPALPHTATSDSTGFDSGNLAPGATFTHRFTEAGTYEYHCALHPSMTATVVVS